MKAFLKMLLCGCGFIFFAGGSVPVREAGFPNVGVTLFVFGLLCLFGLMMFGANYIFGEN